jgi:hypothetical protein
MLLRALCFSECSVHMRQIASTLGMAVCFSDILLANCETAQCRNRENTVGLVLMRCELFWDITKRRVVIL